MKCSEIMDVCRKLAPEDCACDWDNPGLLAGRSDKEVKKIYIALDATDKVVEAAQALGGGYAFDPPSPDIQGHQEGK